MARTRASFQEVKTVMVSRARESRFRDEISLTDIRVIGRGTFGIVYRARLLLTNETVAIKNVIQNQKFKNRELEITRQLNHCNIVKLIYFYNDYNAKENSDMCMHLVLEFFPITLSKVMARYVKDKTTVPLSYTMVYMYQLFRSLAYLHSLGICHRDLKPNNMLLNEETAVLKLCDFGSAKHLVERKKNKFRICAQFYRAPELLLKARYYTTMVDMWSAGCILVELILGYPIFPGESSSNQLAEIMCVLGNPTPKQIKDMNKDSEYVCPNVQEQPWHKVLKGKRFTYHGVDLVSRLLVYTPSARLTGLQACAHSFFDVLRKPNITLREKKLPPLFNFTEHELKIQPDLNSILIPPYLRDGSYLTANERMIWNSVEMEDEQSGSLDCSIASELQPSASSLLLCQDTQF